ncbi:MULTISPECIES: peptidylprolyl isomerase [unclassified Prochlorococcus]|uniref:peptidylprolyl isomerase n=1 Tax=unclassified Prochlorococcus TaxID=2627481 RepID=UPI0005337813|nr:MULTISPECIES: peptidylprolyl isomerase [unclassified Prochlorococcus]KGG27347.1 hypothetical protein EV12_1195 [Prochlorococcus sp. MIT 0701]KGG29413.1 hypothetical protein EV13_1063 [Prochlorococcus sp. MIT 0702]KGG34572.1 hypothetical protein EV14_1156 [Prochlorococcus sp. MIT 0703]
MQEALEKTLMQQVALHGLLQSLIRAQAEFEFINQYELDDEGQPIDDEQAVSALIKDLKIPNQQALQSWRNNHLLNGDDDNFISYAHNRLKRKRVIDKLITGNGESLFLRYKDRLDRVLYSLIRVESEDLAYNLYYSIESGEIEFGSAAESHSCGPESKTQGIIGPVDLTTPHPEVAARLRTASARQLFSPFQADEWAVIVRLEYRFDSSFDESTKDFLGGLLLGSKSKEIGDKISRYYLDKEDSDLAAD